MKVFVVLILCFRLFSNENVVLSEFVNNSRLVSEFSQQVTTILDSTSTDEDVTSPNPSCLNLNPPTLYYIDYKIYWNCNNDCPIMNLNIKCTDSSNPIEFNISTEKYIDTNDESYDFKKGVRYTCTATVLTENSHSETSSELLVPPGSQVISSFKFEKNTITWNPPFENVSLTYNVRLDSWKSNHYIPRRCNYNYDTTITVNTSSLSLIEFPADFTFNVTVSTTFWDISVEGDHSFNTTGAAPGSPTNIAVNDFKFDIETILYNLSWYMPCDANGELYGYIISLSNGNDTYNLNLNVTGDTLQYILPELEPNKNYTVYLKTVGENGLESGFKEYKFSTEEGIPSAPKYEKSSIGATFIAVTWSAPETFTKGRIAKIAEYTINIKSKGPEYIQSNDCQQPVTENIIVDGNTLSYNFTDAWPKYSYEISIAARTSAGEGPAKIINIITDTAAPEEPKNIAVVIEDESTNNITGSLTWVAPCKMNGELKNYLVIISEIYTEETTVVPPNINIKYPIKETIKLFLRPSHNYNFTVIAELKDNITGIPSLKTFRTKDGIPGVPDIYGTDATSTTLTINWNPPQEKVGRIQQYYLHVNYTMPLYEIPKTSECQILPDERNIVLLGNVSSYKITNAHSYSSYQVQVKASTSQWNGSYNQMDLATSQTDPENVRHVSEALVVNELSPIYTATANVTFLPPCNSYGKASYTLECEGKRTGYENHKIFDSKPDYGEKVNDFLFYLRPEHNYLCKIFTENGYSRNYTLVKSFLSPSGVPNFRENFHVPIENVSPYEVKVILKYDFLNMTQGTIKYVALILNKTNIFESLINKWNNTIWPSVGTPSKQITNDWWYPFENSTERTFNIGSGSANNTRLVDDTQYYLIIRIFTDDFYRDSVPILFRTDKISRVGTIVGVLIAILIIAILGGAAFYIWRKGIYKQFPIINQRKINIEPVSATAVPIKKFIQYTKNCENKPEIFKQQFEAISLAAEEIKGMHTSVFATLPENRRKNRYINILPYDATRVKLLIDEDDEIGSDYINASYIKGYSGRVEYLATQGPLSSTIRDFWRMVLQENVTIIVMVANFVENDKQKCDQYFPHNHENLLLGDNIEIRCATELHFGTYIIRNLLVRKDTIQSTVTHMQFLEWPDFKVPTGTEHMLQFCYQLRERVRIEGGIVIVHCSAGVGRTGTLIAADILLQAVNAGKQIDVYNTVLNLRKQRTTMVQTKEQYVYIHHLIADHIDRPRTPDSSESGEILYENVDILKKSKISESEQVKEQESQF